MKETVKKKKSLLFLNLFVGIFLVITLAIGCMAIYSGIRDVFRIVSSQSWPVVEGQILSSTVKEKVSTSRNSRELEYTYGAEIIYTFTVDEQKLTGHLINIGDYASSDRRHAQTIVSRYPAGKSVPVHYNSKNPRLCVLEVGRGDKGLIVELMVGAVFLLIAGLLLILMIIENRSNQAIQPIKPDKFPSAINKKYKLL